MNKLENTPSINYILKSPKWGHAKIFIPIIPYCRMNILKIKSALLVVCLLAMPSLSQAAMDAGIIKAFRVKGGVQLLDESTGVRSPMEEGQTFSQGYTVTTGKNSSVVLLFSNGSSIIVNAESILSVSKFLQEPYDPGLGEYTDLDADPSQSDTLLKMDYGEIIGNVKSLRQESKYQVDTPAGSAGIRGTTYTIKVERQFDEATGIMSYKLTIMNADGTVEFTTEGTTSGTFEPIPEGTEVIIEAEINVESNDLDIISIEWSSLTTDVVNEIVELFESTFQFQATGDIDPNTGAPLPENAPPIPPVSQ